MPIFSGYVETGDDDYDDTNTGNTTIATQSNRDGGGSLILTTHAYTDITTSGVSSTWTITGVTIHFYNDSYVTTPKLETEDSRVYVWDTDESWKQIDWSNSDRIAGWDSVEFIPGDFDTVNTTGTTKFRYVVSSPAVANALYTWEIRAYEYDGGHTYAAYLEVEYTEPGSTRRQRIFIIS